jgi:hypothetical protein
MTLPRSRGPFRYGVYGVSLLSDMPLALPSHTAAGLADIRIEVAASEVFADVAKHAEIETCARDWCRYGRLADRRSYIRWKGLGEFIVSADGRHIACRRFAGASTEAFQVYLIQRALSFALVKQGFEPLHATVVVVDGSAIGFLGDCGSGKSTLAASFLNAGDTLLTDDLLLLQCTATGVLAYPGPSRLKLFPGTARRLVDPRAVGAPMNRHTPKLVIPIESGERPVDGVPLRALYVLESSRAHRASLVRLEPLSPRAACLQMVRNTFNHLYTDPGRLERQFLQASRLALDVPVKRLHYPRVLHRLSAVRDALVADLYSGEHGCLSHLQTA